MAMKAKHNKLVFVYGTLKKGFGNHRWLDGAGFVGKAKTSSIFSMINLGYYPGVLLHGETSITGELYLIDKTIEDRLDDLEGVDSGLYHKTEVDTDKGKALMYYYPRTNLIGEAIHLIKEGVWL